MTENTQSPMQTAQPSPALESLGVLVGTWTLSGETSGTVRYEWLDGGFFLIQHVDLELHGNKSRGMEIIGHLREFGSNAPSADIKSRFYGSGGETFDYVYELDGDTLMIWGGEKGSPAYFKGTFNADKRVMTGAWVYPGGGYDSTMTRVP
ncbi:MAG: hypothetical protein SGI73_15640 [Chloroflexota bacterium]|nr:hypothetical protein [Chloroflexota bacterium]